KGAVLQSPSCMEVPVASILKPCIILSKTLSHFSANGCSCGINLFISWAIWLRRNLERKNDVGCNMIDAGWLNIGSLILGLVAWIIPNINLAGDKKQQNKKWVALTIISFSACTIAICFQIFYNLHLVK